MVTFYELLEPVTKYVEKVAKLFLEQENMSNEFEEIKQAVENNFNNLDYINELLNRVVEAVAYAKGECFNDVRTRFNQTYLNP